MNRMIQTSNRLRSNVKEVALSEKKAIVERIQKKASLYEAKFKAGKAPQLVPKIVRVIAKRLGLQGVAETIGAAYSNSYGKFMGFYGEIGTLLIRLNFKLGKGDILHSIDVYNSDGTSVETTIDLMGYNIVQVVDMVADVISGDYLNYFEESTTRRGKSLREGPRSRSLPNYCAAWLEENPNYLKDVQSGRFDYARYAPEFISYIQSNFGSTKREIKPSALQANVKKALEQNNLGVSPVTVPGVTVKPGAKVDTTLLDPEIAAIWDDIKELDPQEKIDDMREGIRDLADPSAGVYCILIYGKAGVGKDFHVEDVLKEEGVKPKYITAPISGKTGLLALLYQNKDDEILVFSDNDSAFNNSDMINLWKNVLDSKPVRMVNLPTEPYRVRGQQGDDNKTLVIEEDFEFTSKVIFISNMMEFDSAVVSRMAGYDYFLNFTLEEVMYLIKNALGNLYADNPDVTDTMRTEVYEFVSKATPIADDVDFRVFQAGLRFRLLANRGGSDWKRRTLKALTKGKRG